MSLDLFGFLPGHSPQDNNGAERFIFGFLKEGKRVTLYRCLRTQVSTTGLGEPVYAEARFVAELAFIGAHFATDEDLTFTKLWASYFELDEWASLPGLDISHAGDDADVVVKYTPSQPELLCTSDEFKIEMGHHLAPYSLTPVQKKIQLEQRTDLIVTWELPQSLDSVTDMSVELGNFLSLATLGSAYPLTMVVQPSVSHYAPEEATSVSRRVEMYFHSAAATPTDRPKVPLDMVFTYHQVRDRIEALLAKWLERRDLLRPIRDLYFGTLQSSHMYVHQRFLNAAHGLESFHRRTVPENVSEVQSLKLRRSRILDNVGDDNDRSWLEEKLKWSTEPSLRQRLRELFSSHGYGLEELVPDQSRFVNEIVATRHHLTHHEEPRPGTVTDPADLFVLSEKMLLLLYVCLLSDLGFVESEIRNMLAESQYIVRERAWLSSTA